MSDFILTLTLPQEQGEQLEHRARERGYESIEAYLLALAEADEDDDLLEDTAALESSFKRAWRDAQQGNLLTEDEFWKALKDGD